MAGHAQLIRQIQTRRWGAGTQAQFDHRARRVAHLEAALAEARAELELARRSHEAAREHDGRLDRQLGQLYALWRPGWPSDLAGDVCGRIFAYTSRPDVARCVASCARISQAVERAGVIRFVLPPRHISIFSTGVLVGAGHDVAVFLESGDRVDATRVDVPCPVSALAAGGALNVCAAADGQVYVWDMRAGRLPWPVFEAASGRAVTDAVALAAGAKTIVLVGSDGSLLQATVEAAVPMEPLVPSPHLVRRVEADNGAAGFVGCVVGFMTAYAWDERGGVWAWSLGNARALRVLTRLTRVVKVVATGDDEDGAIAMTDYGQLWSFSASTAAAMLLMGARVIDVAAGSLHVLYVSTEHGLYGYGSAVPGVLPQQDGCSPGPLALQVACGPVLRVAAHRQRSACLAVDGSVWTWGPSREPRLVTRCI